MTRAQKNEYSQSSVDDGEIARFSAVSEDWWSDTGAFAPLHKFTPIRIDFIRDALTGRIASRAKSDKPFTGMSVLDIGCGGGLIAEPMTRLGADVLGVDAAEASIAAAKAHAEDCGLNISYRTAAAEDLVKEGLTFDVVIASEVVEHVADLDLFAKCCSDLLRPGGWIILTTLNRTLKSLALAKFGVEYILRWAPVGTHDWNKFVTPDELRATFQRNHIDLDRIEGFVYRPISDRFVRSNDLAINYGAAGQKTFSQN